MSVSEMKRNCRTNSCGTSNLQLMQHYDKKYVIAKNQEMWLLCVSQWVKKKI